MDLRSGFTLLALLLLAAGARAADVEADVSTRETYVGLPVVLQIHIHNASQHEAPMIPDVDGLEIEPVGPAARSSQISIINGRRTERRTATYSFRVTPQREGTFTIPPIKVVSDGRVTISKAVRIVASKSDTDDLMFVEIEGNKNEIYVGEALELTLKIWIRPYRDREFQVSLDEGDMWSSISEQTSWGAFAERLQQMAQDRKRPGGKSVLRKDASGNEREYFLYEIDVTVYPDRPGQIDGDDVSIIVNYPVQLGRSRSPLSIFEDDDIFGGTGLFGDSMFRDFGSRIGIKKARPIVAEATVDPILVRPIPDSPRPDNYRGAVGTYTILTGAKPIRVKVGDPITLQIGIEGTGPLDVVRAPPLATQENLIRDFKVPDEPLAGFVEQSRKVFSTTIRPLHEGVTEIPPIAMSYFDPQTEEFVTTTSDPIPIQVEPADVLALDAIVGGKRTRVMSSKGRESPAKQPTTELALFTGPELLRSVEPASIVSSRLVSMLILPPVFALAAVAFASRQVLSGLVSARSEFRKAVSLAQSPAEIAEALEHFLARRFRLDDSRQTRDQTVGRLRAAGHHDLAIRAERLYASCKKPMSGVPMEHSMKTLKDEAIRIVEDLDRTRRIGRSGEQLRQLSSSSAMFLMALSVALRPEPALATGVSDARSGSGRPAASAAGSKEHADGNPDGDLFGTGPQASVDSDEYLMGGSEPGQVGVNLMTTLETDTIKESTPNVLTLSYDQQRMLLDEAVSIYESVSAKSDRAESKDQFARAAGKFQLLVDSGIENDRLYCNLAAAQLRAGQVGHAIANYRRALRLEPANQRYRENLALAEQTAEQPTKLSGVLASVGEINDVVLRYIPPKVMRGLFVSAWAAFWAILILRVFRIPFHWKSAALLTFLCALLAAGSYLLRVLPLARDDAAVLVELTVSLREGDGTEFAEIRQLSDAQGRVVRVLGHRGDWTRIGLDGATGWIPADACEEI